MAVKIHENEKKRSCTLNKLDKMLGYIFPVQKHSEMFVSGRGIYLFNRPEGNNLLLFEISIPQKNTSVLCWTHRLNHKPCTVKKKICIYAINLLCLVLHHAYPPMELTKGFIISYVQYFAYLYLMFHYVHVCAFKVTIHSNIHAKH